MEIKQLLINLILFGVLPLWGIAGFVDWCCHKASKIEQTSGLKESLIHSLMGVQLGIPILLGLLFEINVLILLICIAAWVAHEMAAHWDVHYTTPLRKITIWEVHAHNYMATLPLYLLILIGVINWPVVVKLFTLNWQGQFQLKPMPYPHGGDHYLTAYLVFMGTLCVFPYLEENYRCFKAYLKNKHLNGVSH